MVISIVKELISYWEVILQFDSLPVRINLSPAIGPEPLLQAVEQATAFGGADFILLDPYFLDDYGFVDTLRSQSGYPVCAFGWSSDSPQRDIIENAPIDGFLVRFE